MQYIQVKCKFCFILLITFTKTIIKAIKLIWNCISEVQIRNIWKIQFEFPSFPVYLCHLSRSSKMDNSMCVVKCELNISISLFTCLTSSRKSNSKQQVGGKGSGCGNDEILCQCSMSSGFERSFTCKLLHRTDIQPYCFR